MVRLGGLRHCPPLVAAVPTHEDIQLPPSTTALIRRSLTSPPHDASLRQVVRRSFSARELAFFCWSAERRRVMAGPGVAWPKSRRPGREPAALATESFPACPPGPWMLAAAMRAASAFRHL
jgi:hypothetical protein